MPNRIKVPTPDLLPQDRGRDPDSSPGLEVGTGGPALAATSPNPNKRSDP